MSAAAARMACVPYTEEQDIFIGANYRYMTYSELANALKNEFGRDAKATTVKQRVRDLGLPPKSPNCRRSYSVEQDAFIKKHYASMTESELATAFETEFGWRPGERSIGHRKRKMGLRKGNSFQHPGEWAPLGTEKVDKNGRTKVKVAHPVKGGGSKYVEKTVLLFGYDTKTHRALHLDGDLSNQSPENIVIVRRSVVPRLAKAGWFKKGEAVLKTGIKLCELLDAIKELEGEE